MLPIKKIEEVRTIQRLNDMLSNATVLISERYFDPKNVAKGSHLNEEPLKILRWIQGEALEAVQAYTHKEGRTREREELADVMLLCAMRIDKIQKEEEFERDNV